MNNPIFREADIGDQQELRRLYGEFVNSPDRYFSGNQDSFLHVINSDRSKIIVASVSQKLVGFVMFSSRDVFRYPTPIVEIEEIFVAPDFRRNGIARRFMDLVLEWARRQNATYIFLGSDKNRTEAYSFYRSLNYIEYGLHYRLKL